MAYSNRDYEYPYTNPTQPNLDWLLNTVKAQGEAIDDLQKRVTALEAKES